MARLKNKNAPRRRRCSPVRRRCSPVRRPEAEDRLSSLPDALLRRVLSHLDTRTALSTAVLSRRWARLPRDLPALRFSVADVLPQRYFHALDRRRRAGDADGKLLRYIKRCDRRAMRAYLDGIAGILDAPGARRRRAEALYLEFFRTDGAGAGTIDRMIEAAVGEWGVQHLDVVVLRSAPRDPPLPVYVFPDHLLDGSRSRLRSLTLGHCGVLPPPLLHRYAALQRLVLQDTPACTPMDAYAAVFDGGAAAALRVVHLLCCRGASDVLEIDAPCSGVEELVVDSCSFRAIELRDLPELRRLACLSDGEGSAPAVVELSFGVVPRLTHVNLTFSAASPAAAAVAAPPAYRVLDSLLAGAPPSMSRLAVRFTGPRRWILPRPLDTALLGLRELLVADVPPTWDISWPRLLLEAAPALETLHVHVAAAAGSSSPEGGRPIYWQPRGNKFRHRQLREVCMVGFANTPRQTRFLRYLVRVCEPLERVVLVRKGRVEEDGLWGWKTVEQRDRPWTLADWISVTSQIKHGTKKPHVEVTLI